MKSPFPAAVPEIPVNDLKTALAYYKSNLGFTIDWGGDGGNIAGISKGNCRMFLTDGFFHERYKNFPPVLVWINLDRREDVNELHQDWSESGAKIISPPEAKFWKLYEFTVADTDGNLFRVFYDFSGEDEVGE